MTGEVPKSIERLGHDGVRIVWRAGDEYTLDAQTLRTSCPCAQCRELRGDQSHAKPLSSSSQRKPRSLQVVEHSLESSLRLERLWGVGNYAIGMQWRDGHSSGIYTFEYLWQLCNEKAAREGPCELPSAS